MLLLTPYTPNQMVSQTRWNINMLHDAMKACTSLHCWVKRHRRSGITYSKFLAQIYTGIFFWIRARNKKNLISHPIHTSMLLIPKTYIQTDGYEIVNNWTPNWSMLLLTPYTPNQMVSQTRLNINMLHDAMKACTCLHCLVKCHRRSCIAYSKFLAQIYTGLLDKSLW